MNWNIIDDMIFDVRNHKTPDVSGPELKFSQELHAAKYRSEGETFRSSMTRIAGALKDDEEHFHTLKDILLEMRFLPAGRIQSAMGSNKSVTPFNCFVSGVIEDNLVEGMYDDTFFNSGGIMARAVEAAQTMKMGGGIGYDFSKIRPKGELIRSQDTRASGPVSYMPIFNAVCGTIASAGHRRGAQMAVLRVDHPDIEEFIHAKQNEDQLQGFNISVGVTDKFIEAVQQNASFDLVWNDKVYKTIDAGILWEQIMRATWDFAEPGVLFIDTINRENNLSYCETISAVNPCAEQPLPPFGACLLGSFNLTSYVEEDDEGYYFKWKKFNEDISTVVRALDNVIDLAKYPLKEQEAEAKNKRRMGLGITGLANTGEAIGFPYGSDSFITFTESILAALANRAYEASALIAKEKGPFPLYEAKAYANGEFIKRLKPETQKLIKEHGLRNSHLTSIAPTGTISLCADNISSGLEPVFAHIYDRTVMTFEGPIVETIEDYGVRVFNVWGKTASECTIEDHLRVLISAYKYVDSAVSKTCNVSPDMPWEDFKAVYFRAWEGGCKGCSTFNVEGKRMGILKKKEEDAAETTEACLFDPETGTKTCE